MTPSGDDLSGFSLLDLFRAEVAQHATALDEGLVALEADPKDAARLEELMRSSHSIKGAARIVGVDPAVRVAHAMEDCFVAAQKGRVVLGPEAIDALLAGADALRTIGGLSDGDAPTWFAAHAADLAALVERIRAASLSEAAPAVATTPPPPPTPTVSPAPPPAPASSLPPAPPDPPQPSARATSAATADESQVVRVSATGLGRMLAYAGESLVEARRLGASGATLAHLRRAARRLTAEAATASSAATAGRTAEAGEAIVAARATSEEVRRLSRVLAHALADSARRAEDLADRLYREVLKSRMRPFGDGVGAFPRLVRDLAKDLGKRARLEIRGREVLVDRDVLERLDAPLQHLLRNALDHGIEEAAARAAAGKDPEGRIVVEARHRAGLLEVEVSDDGRGIDPERVRARAVETGLAPAALASGLSRAEVLDFLFLPGFSTRDRVTDVSGRGVGLDVVLSFAQGLGGLARVESGGPGAGARFTLVLPITRSVVRAAIVEVAGHPYALPLARIERLLRAEAADLGSAEGRQHVVHEGNPVGVVPAAQILGLDPGARTSDTVYVVLIEAGGHRYGLVVDRFLGEEDLVVRPLDARLGRVANVSAASVREDGDPVLILDVEDLVRSVDLLLGEGRLRSIHVVGRADEAAKRRKRVLVVDDSITVRELQRGLLARRGYAVDVAVDGADAWNAVLAVDYDLVVTDVDMPRMGGIELVRRIRQDERRARTPVMIVSYKDREEDRRRGLEAGADAYVAKGSFEEDAWAAAVADLIGGPEA